MKVRQNLYIDREIADALEALAAGPGGNKSRLVNDALAAWLARRGTKEIDDLFKGRLDRMSRELATIRRDGEVLRESLSLFVRSSPSPRRCPTATRWRWRSAATGSRRSSARSVASLPAPKPDVRNLIDEQAHAPLSTEVDWTYAHATRPPLSR